MFLLSNLPNVDTFLKNFIRSDTETEADTVECGAVCRDEDLG